MQENIFVFKIKFFLILSILPISYLVYHLIGFDNGINAYVEKKKTLNNQQTYQNLLENKIIKYKEKIKLLDPNAIDLDYLEEKALDLYGGTEKNAYNIILK